MPFPLSSLSPVPISDPHLCRSPVVQLQLCNNPHQNLSQLPDKDGYFGPQPSDQQNQPIGGGSNYQVSSVEAKEVKKVSKDCLVSEIIASNLLEFSTFWIILWVPVGLHLCSM